MDAQKRPGKPKIMWEKLLVNDKRKFGMVSTDLQNPRVEGTSSRKTCRTSPTLGRGKQAIKSYDDDDDDM
ncbi:MAG: hypothetical protein AB2693_23145 [Candidatus Thiodiazotropha sp.]